MTLEVRLPEDATSRPLLIQPDGSFEERCAAHLPRLRAAERKVWFTLRHRDERVEQAESLFAPRPGAQLGVIVLAAGVETPTIPDRNGHAAGDLSLSEVSREITRVASSCTDSAGPLPVFYLGRPRCSGRHDCTNSRPDWPAGLPIPFRSETGSAGLATCAANWITRLLELYAGELEFVLVADTSRVSAATLRTLARQALGVDRLRAVFLSDTRPVARGVRLQLVSPPGIDGLALPIVVCRTLDEARRAAVTTGIHAESLATNTHHGSRRTATHTRVTRYPLVFCHGMLGYSVLKLRNVDLNNYFNGLRELLTERGFRVLMPQIGRTHSIEQRAEQLRQAIGRWTSEPVNIIGHSMGGLDARFLISKGGFADRVVSLTTIATPHHGSSFADWFVDGFDHRLPFLRSLEQFGLEVDGFRDCTRAACHVFNQVVPDSPKVRYLSYSAFQVPRKIPPALRRSHSLIAAAEGANDGLVSERSARWGEHVTTLRADHLALVGERGPEYFDHLAFYTRIVHDLIRLGF
jgi:triacylglycerol lipase